MAEPAPRTDKRFQLTVLGLLAIGAIVLLGGMATILETSTIRNAGLMLLLGLLVVIAALAVDL